MEPGLELQHASLKEVDVYLPHSHISASSKPKSEVCSSLLTPELSVVSEHGEILGIDVHTGLPRLAVELLPEMEEGRPMGPQISSTRNYTASGQSAKRKSVSFDPKSDASRQRSMSESKVGQASSVAMNRRQEREREDERERESV